MNSPTSAGPSSRPRTRSGTAPTLDYDQPAGRRPAPLRRCPVSHRMPPARPRLLVPAPCPRLLVLRLQGRGGSPVPLRPGALPDITRMLCRRPRTPPGANRPHRSEPPRRARCAHCDRRGPGSHLRTDGGRFVGDQDPGVGTAHDALGADGRRDHRDAPRERLDHLSLIPEPNRSRLSIADASASAPFKSSTNPASTLTLYRRIGPPTRATLPRPPRPITRNRAPGRARRTSGQISLSSHVNPSSLCGRTAARGRRTQAGRPPAHATLRVRTSGRRRTSGAAIARGHGKRRYGRRAQQPQPR